MPGAFFSMLPQFARRDKRTAVAARRAAHHAVRVPVNADVRNSLLSAGLKMR